MGDGKRTVERHAKPAHFDEVGMCGRFVARHIPRIGNEAFNKIHLDEVVI